MENAIRILFVEDKLADFRLVERHLQKEGLLVECHRVRSAAELQAALDAGDWDLVLSDYNVPALAFEDTLRRLEPRLEELPLILVSGSVGEERAVELLRLGVWDFVLKDNLTRLPTAIRRDLRDAAERRARRKAEEAVRVGATRLADLNACLVSFGPDFDININRLVAFLGEQLTAACALYSRLEGRRLHAVGRWHTPPDFCVLDQAEGRICYDVIRGAEPQVKVFSDLLHSPYAQTDPVIISHGLKTCFGTVVLDEGKPIGSLCAFFKEERVPSPEDLNLLGILASAVGVEERRKRSKAALQSSEEFKRAVLDSVTSHIAVLDHEGVIVEVNAPWLEFARANPTSTGELAKHAGIGANYLEICRQSSGFSAEGGRAVYQGIRDVLAGRKAVFTMEYPCHSPEVQRWFSLVVSPLGKNGSGVVVSHTSITERKLAEQALAESENRFRQMTACLADVLYGVDGESREFSYLSPAFTRNFGYTAEDVHLLGGREQFLAAVIQDGKFEAQRALFMEMQSTLSEAPTPWESWWLCKDGALKFIEDLSIPVYAGGRLQATYGVLRDITERKRAEAALRQSEEQFRAMFEMASIGMVQTNPLNRQFLRVNRKMTEITGYAPEELLQMTVSDVTHPDDRDREQHLFQSVILGETPNYRIEKRYLRKDGTIAWVNVNMTPIRDVSGQPLRTMSTIEDITERKRLEAQFRQSQKMEAIGTLAGGVAHDFNNILTSILMQVELSTVEGNLSPDLAEGLEQIRADAERAASLTRQLLLFSRRQIMQSRDLDLNEVVTNLVKMLQRIIGEDVRLQLQLHPAPLLTHADPGMLDQVLMNLAVNARDAMPQGGRVIIETSAVSVDDVLAKNHPDAMPGRYVCLSVRDTGSGIPPEALPRIFEPFFTTKEAGKGTGLGLATVFGIVKQHRGWLKVESQPGRGTTFQIFLPAILEVAKPAASAVRPVQQGGTETLLLVEDEVAVRLATRSILARLGYQVLEAANGPEALKVWAENRSSVALLLSDLVMPGGLTGQQLGRRLQADKPDLKVIYISGYSADVAGREIDLQPGENYLQKPFRPEDLFETIRSCLDK